MYIHFLRYDHIFACVTKTFSRARGPSVPAPPLENPMGRMLFEEALAPACLRAKEQGPLDLRAWSRAVARVREDIGARKRRSDPNRQAG